VLQLGTSKVAQQFSIIPLTEFKASYRWVWWFLNHQQLSICRRTTLYQRLPEEY
jgi:hypothetical protein